MRALALPATPATNRFVAARVWLSVLILAAPLPLGSVRPGAVLALQLSAVVACALVTGALDGPLPRPLRRAALPAGLLLGLGTLQLVPLPAAALQWLSPAQAAARAALAEPLPEVATSFSATSVSPAATLHALLHLAALSGFGFAAAVAFRRKAHVRLLAIAAVTAGTFQALYGAAELFSGRQHIFGYAKHHYLEAATGTFINRNHFAGFLAMTLPFALGLVLDGPEPERRAAGRERWLAPLRNPSGARTLAALATATIVLGILLSSSRGGLIAAGTGVFVVLARRGVSRTVLAGLVAAVAAPAAWILRHGVAAPGERFLLLPEQWSTETGRLAVWGASLRAVREHLWLGSGFGTFEQIFPYYRPASVGLHYAHAHNDWLQLLVEAGIPGLVLASWLAWRTLRPGNSTATSRYVLDDAVLAALAAVAVHALVDFPLRMPAIAVLAAILVGVRLRGQA